MLVRGTKRPAEAGLALEEIQASAGRAIGRRAAPSRVDKQRCQPVLLVVVRSRRLVDVCTDDRKQTKAAARSLTATRRPGSTRMRSESGA
jgi:hypothetical protein